jgi:predicted MFS family arabinose efflux permease
MEKVLSGPWSWSFYISSLIARLPLDFLPVILILGTINKGVASSGTLLASIAIGAALAGVVQGPLWDRLAKAPFMFILSFTSTVILIIFSIVGGEGLLALALIGLYGFIRPQTSTVTRSVWMNRFSESSSLSSKSISLDIASTPVLGIVGPLLAGLSFSAFGFSFSIILIALVTFLAALVMLFLIQFQGYGKAEKNPASMFKSIKNFFTHPPLVTILVLAAFSASASGVITILLSANLEARGVLDLLSPMLALNAAAIILGAYLFKRFVESPGNYLHIFLFIESLGLFLYVLGFAAQLPVLWTMIFLGGLVVAPLGTFLYILIESRSKDGDRAASFSLLATAQFLGLSIGQLVFSRVAQATSPEAAMLIAAIVQFICFLAWVSLPYGMKKYRIQKTFSWWPENLEGIILKDPVKKHFRVNEEIFAQIRPYLKNEIDQGVVPDLPRSFRSDSREEQSPALVGIVKIAWDEAWHAQRPTVERALECGEWMKRNKFSARQIENVALYLGFEHRDFIEEEVETQIWRNYSYEAVLFANIFHTARLRASRMYFRMNDWFKEEMFLEVENETISQIIKMLTHSALGQKLDFNQYEELWNESVRVYKVHHLFILIDALNLSLTQPGHAELLLKKTNEYLNIDNEYGYYSIWAFKARGERFLGRLDDAKISILKSYNYLPFSENRRSNAIFVEQLDIERMMIDSLINERDQK